MNEQITVSFSNSYKLDISFSTAVKRLDVVAFGRTQTVIYNTQTYQLQWNVPQVFTID